MLALVAVLGLAPLTGRAGTLTGHVKLHPASSLPASAPSNPYAGMLGSIRTERTDDATGDPRDVVLWLQGVTGSPPARSETPKLYQINQNFEPRVLGVPVGATVEFPNQDPIFHNVFSYSKTKRFDLGKYGKGKSETVTFEKPGLVKVFCDIHSNMSAFIYVVDSPWVLQPDAMGDFRFDGLPNGTYELQIWHPERGSRVERVYITDRGTQIDLAF